MKTPAPKWTDLPDSGGIWWRGKSQADWDIGSPVGVRKIESWGHNGHRIYCEVEHNVPIVAGENYWYGPFIVVEPIASASDHQAKESGS